MNLKFWKRNLVTKHFRFHSNFWGVDVTVCSCHVTYAFQSEYALYSCLNVKELRFKQGVPWYSGNYRVWIHSETRTWHDKNIQSDELFLQNGWLRFIFSRNDCYRLSPQQTFDRCSDYYYSISAQLHSTKLAIRLCECSNPAARSKSQFW